MRKYCFLLNGETEQHAEDSLIFLKMALIPIVQFNMHNQVYLKPCAFTFISQLPKIELLINLLCYISFMLLKDNLDMDLA